LLAPLSQFIYNLTDSLKSLNEGQISVSSLSDSLQKFAPIIMGAATALSAFAGGSILSIIPGLGNITALVGLKSPLVLGFIALTAVSDELRDTAKKLVVAVLPLAKAFAQLSEVMAGQLIVLAEAFVPLLVGMVQAITPVVAALAQFAEFATRSAEVTKVLAAAMLVLYARSKLMKAEIGVGLVGSMKSFTAGAKENIRYQKALATQAGVSATSFQLFGAAAVTSFRAAAVAAKAFIASLLPLAAITAGVWALTAAFSAFNNRNKDAKERMEELTPRVEELVDELARGELTALGFGDAMARLGEILLDDTTDGGKKTADALRAFGVEGDKAVDTAIRLHTEFDQVALELLAVKGITGEAADELVELVNFVDKGDIGLGLSGRTKYLVEQLEELQDQVENSGDVMKLLASEMLAEAEAQGALTDALYEEIEALTDANDHSGAYELALAAVNAQLLEQERLLRYKIEAQSIDEAQLERLIFLNQTYAERLGHVADETTLITSLGYEQARATRNTVRQMNKLTDELADSDKELSSLLKAGDSFVELLADTTKEMREAGKSTDQINSMIAVLSTRFAEAAGEAGYTQEQIDLLAQDILALSGMSVDLPVGITLTGNVSEQIKAIRGQIRSIEQRVMIEPHLASQIKPLEDMLSFFEPLESAFGMIDASGGSFGNSAKEMDDAADSASRLANELDDVADAYREIVQELLSVDFALTNSEVLLEELRDRALEVAKAFDQMSDAKRLQEFHGQLQQVLSMMRDLAASGASMSEIDNFVQQLIGPNGALAVFAKSAGISAEDFAKAVAAIEGFQFQIGQEQQFAAATANMTPAEVEQFSKYLLGLEASGAIPTQSYSTAPVSAGSTTINVNLPPGVSGVDVVNALQDYAQTSGASIQAPFEFVNLG
jgi:archaellum component FlaC